MGSPRSISLSRINMIVVFLANGLVIVIKCFRCWNEADERGDAVWKKGARILSGIEARPPHPVLNH